MHIFFAGHAPQAKATVQRAGKEQAATAVAGGKSCEVCCVAHREILKLHTTGSCTNWFLNILRVRFRNSVLHHACVLFRAKAAADEAAEVQARAVEEARRKDEARK